MVKPCISGSSDFRVGQLHIRSSHRTKPWATLVPFFSCWITGPIWFLRYGPKLQYRRNLYVKLREKVHFTPLNFFAGALNPLNNFSAHFTHRTIENVVLLPHDIYLFCLSLYRSNFAMKFGGIDICIITQVSTIYWHF